LLRIKATSPVGVPEPDPAATAPLKVTDPPCAIPVVGDRFRLVLELLKTTLFHWLERLAALIEPSPVARS